MENQVVKNMEDEIETAGRGCCSQGHLNPKPTKP